MALALESMGFSRYASTPEHSRGLLKTKREPIDAITMTTRTSGSIKPARYVMITGEKDFSQNNNEDIKYVTNKANANGENVKVILISMAASEGLDFKNIRQIHILEPWYNMNRIEQIIGRGVRNLSHCHLPFEERNVEIYLHGTVLDYDEEAADVYVYRSAERKAVQIGRVTRVLKEISVDCLFLVYQQRFQI
jgi:superfamily II DNA or RNA helicase